MTFVDHQTSSGARFSAISLILFLFLSAVALSAKSVDVADGVKASPSLSFQASAAYRPNGPDSEGRAALKGYRPPNLTFWLDHGAVRFSFDIAVTAPNAFSARGPPQV